MGRGGLSGCVRTRKTGCERRGRLFLGRTSLFVFPACCRGRYFPLMLLRTVRRKLPYVDAGRKKVPNVVRRNGAKFVIRGRDPRRLTRGVRCLVSRPVVYTGVNGTNGRGFRERFALRGFRGQVGSVLGRYVTSCGGWVRGVGFVAEMLIVLRGGTGVFVTKRHNLMNSTV